MAEEKKEASHWEFILIFALVFGGLIALWFYNGGPERADLRGIFLSPPPPVGTGDAYGPQVGEPRTPDNNGYNVPRPTEDPYTP